MKKFFSIAALAVLMALSTNFASAQVSGPKIIDQVEEALKSGSSKELSKFLHSRVEIKLDNVRKQYSLNQAEIVLKDFFQKQPSSGAEFIHDGTSNGGMIYAIGSYSSGSNSYRVMLRAKKYEEAYKVYHLEFTKER